MNYFHITRKKLYTFGPFGETGKGVRLLFKVREQVFILDKTSPCQLLHLIQGQGPARPFRCLGLTWATTVAFRQL